MRTKSLHISVFISIFFFLVASTNARDYVSAATPTIKTQVSASPSKKETKEKEESAITPTPEENLMDKLKQIKILKEKIATKVAELRDHDRAGIYGKVKSISSSSIIVTAKNGERTLNFSEDIEVFSLSSSGKTASSLKKISEGDMITAFGYIDETKHVMVTSRVYIEGESPLRVMGKIVDIDKSNYTVTVKGKEGQTIVDIEKNTKTLVFDKKAHAFIRSGFSKMSVGDIIHVVGTPHATEEHRISANRIASLTLTTPESGPSPTNPVKPTSPSEKESPTPTKSKNPSPSP